VILVVRRRGAQEQPLNVSSRHRRTTSAVRLAARTQVQRVGRGGAVVNSRRQRSTASRVRRGVIVIGSSRLLQVTVESRPPGRTIARQQPATTRELMLVETDRRTTLRPTTTKNRPARVAVLLAVVSHRIAETKSHVRRGQVIVVHVGLGLGLGQGQAVAGVVQHRGQERDGTGSSRASSTGPRVWSRSWASSKEQQHFGGVYNA